MLSRIVCWPLVAALVLVGAAAAADTEPAGIDRFFGTYTGESLHPADEYGRRSLHVDIGPNGDDGFTVAWTTAMEKRRGERSAISDRLDFVPTRENPNVFRALPLDRRDPPIDPLTSERYAWAAMKDAVLSVHVLTIEPDGDYVVQTYDRALNDHGLTLSFVRVRSGDVEQRIWGSLDRQEQ